MDTLSRVEDGVLSEECLTVKITPQRGLIQLGEAKDLLARPTRGGNGERGALKAVPVGDQGARSLGQIALVDGTGLLRELQLVQRSGHRVVQFLGRSEVSGENPAGPAPHLLDESLLSCVSLDVPLDERKDGAPGLGLPVLLVGRGDPRRLAIPVSGAEQEQDDVGQHTPARQACCGASVEALKSSDRLTSYRRTVAARAATSRNGSSPRTAELMKTFIRASIAPTSDAKDSTMHQALRSA
jgi:hypothetical protein